MRIAARLLALLLALLLCAGSAMAEETLPQPLLLLLKQLGYESAEAAMEALGLETQEELIALAQTLLKAMTTSVTSETTTVTTEDEPTPPERSFDGKVLATMEMEASAEEILYFFTVQLGIPIADFVCFPTVNEAIFALKTGKIDTLLSMDASATYMASQDETLYTYMDPRLKDFNQISLSMVVLKKNAELGERLNGAIATLKESGELDAMISAMFSGIVPEPTPLDASAQTVYVGVTGDIPPVDYVDASGNPVGFNVALMSRIGALLGVNVEFVQTNKGAIIMALATGKIDIVFWQEQTLSEEMAALIGDLSDSLFVTDPFLTLDVTAIELK